MSISIISDQEENSADPDQTAWMCRLIWIYTGGRGDKRHDYGMKGLSVKNTTQAVNY
jgi:hypothetical protein